MVAMSFYTLVNGMPTPAFSLENYVTLFTSWVYAQVIVTSVRIALEVTLVSFLIGFPTAYFMATVIKNDSTKTLFLMVMLVPFWIDWTIRTMAWFPILGTNGLVNYALESWGITKAPLNIFQNEFAAVVAMVEAYVLFMIAPIFLSMNRIERGLLQAAESLGASRFRTFYEVVWKLSLPGVAIGWLFVLIMSLSDFATPGILGGPETQTIGRSIAYSTGVLNWPLAGAYSTILIVLIFVMVLLIFKLVDVKSMIF
jgi:putative spermidine/putrescine transport system permease protein